MNTDFFENLLYILIASYIFSSTVRYVLKTAYYYVKNNPKFALQSFMVSSLSAYIGYLYQGYVSIELTLYGFSGFIVYLLFNYSNFEF